MPRLTKVVSVVLLATFLLMLTPVADAHMHGRRRTHSMSSRWWVKRYYARPKRSPQPVVKPTPTPTPTPTATPTDIVPSPEPTPTPTPTEIPVPTPGTPWVAPSFTCEGFPLQPGDDVPAIVAAKPAGTTFCFSPGTYRLTTNIAPKAGDAFIGAPGTVLNGSKLLTEFTREAAFWVASGQTQKSSERGTCTLPDGACKYPEAVFVDNVQLTQVVSLSALSAGEFFFDYTADKIYISDDPSGHKVEATAVRGALRSDATGVTVKGLVIEKFDNPAAEGAISAHGWVIEGNEVRFNGGVGVCGWDGSHVINNRIHHNGQMGLCGQGADIVVENNEVDHNNTQGHHYGWEAGGSKWVKTTNLIVRGNYSHHNYGIGFWTDINNVHTLYENNVISDNDAIGIFHEVSYDAVIRNNVIRDNGFGVDWSVDGSGIKVSSSPDVEIYGNTIADNAGGVMLTQYERSDTSIPTGFAPHLNRNNYVHDNTFVLSHGRVGAMVASSSADAHICDAASNNRYRRNTYTLPTSSTTAFLWCGNPITQSAWRQLSMDQP